MKKPLMFRQGDVLVVAIAALPEGVKREKVEGRVVLAYGEVTGHAHAIAKDEVKSFRSKEPIPVFDWNAERFLQVTSRALLRHEEHGAIEIPAGTYAVVTQREYHPEELRRVED
jgi:hypothetical protein